MPVTIKFKPEIRSKAEIKSEPIEIKSEPKIKSEPIEIQTEPEIKSESEIMSEPEIKSELEIKSEPEIKFEVSESEPTAAAAPANGLSTVCSITTRSKTNKTIKAAASTTTSAATSIRNLNVTANATKYKKSIPKKSPTASSSKKEKKVKNPKRQSLYPPTFEPEIKSKPEIKAEPPELIKIKAEPIEIKSEPQIKFEVGESELTAAAAPINNLSTVCNIITTRSKANKTIKSASSTTTTAAPSTKNPNVTINAAKSKETVALSSKKEKQTKHPRRKILHPTIPEMVNNAIKGLKKRGGSSLQAIKKYIATNYKVDAEKSAPFIKKYLKSAAASGSLVQTKGKGASGSFKLASAASSRSAMPNQRKKIEAANTEKAAATTFSTTVSSTSAMPSQWKNTEVANSEKIAATTISTTVIRKVNKSTSEKRVFTFTAKATSKVKGPVYFKEREDGFYGCSQGVSFAIITDTDAVKGIDVYLEDENNFSIKISAVKDTFVGVTVKM